MGLIWCMGLHVLYRGANLMNSTLSSSGRSMSFTGGSHVPRISNKYEWALSRRRGLPDSTDRIATMHAGLAEKRVPAHGWGARAVHSGDATDGVHGTYLGVRGAV